MLLDYGAKQDTEESWVISLQLFFPFHHSKISRLLYLCANWISEGPHIYAVQQLLAHGYDVSLVNSQSLMRWPQGSNPDWIGEGYRPDPFFVDLIRYSVERDPGKNSFPTVCHLIRFSS